jgi:transcriptional regulator with XRE-family HTH domain
MEADLTQEELAERAGITLTKYKNLEHLRTPDPKLLDYVRLSKVLGCELTELLEDEWLTSPLDVDREALGLPRTPPPALS